MLVMVVNLFPMLAIVLFSVMGAALALMLDCEDVSHLCYEC